MLKGILTSVCSPKATLIKQQEKRLLISFSSEVRLGNLFQGADPREDAI